MQRMLAKMAVRQLMKVADGKDALLANLRGRAAAAVAPDENDVMPDGTPVMSLAETPEPTHKAQMPSQEMPSGAIKAKRRGAARKPMSIKPMLDDAGMDLFFWLTEELEIASPTLSVHAKTPLSGLVQFGGPLPQGYDEALRHELVDLVIIDETGLPVAALIFDAVGQDVEVGDQVADLLEMAELPALQLDPEADPDAIWEALRPLIAYEIAA